MRKTYSFHIQDNTGRWKVEYESKSKCSRIKGKLIKALWKEEGLTVEGIRCKIAITSSHIPSSHQMGNILQSYDLFKTAGKTTVTYLGTKCDRIMLWKLNESSLEIKQVA